MSGAAEQIAVKRLTAKQAAQHAGRSIAWLRNHECAWCEQTCLRQLMYGCGAIHDRCNPLIKMFTNESKLR